MEALAIIMGCLHRPLWRTTQACLQELRNKTVLSATERASREGPVGGLGEAVWGGGGTESLRTFSEGKRNFWSLASKKRSTFASVFSGDLPSYCAGKRLL